MMYVTFNLELKRVHNVADEKGEYIPYSRFLLFPDQLAES